MKLDGETMKFKVPIQVKDVVKDHPEHVVMDSEAVRHLGVRAKPMDGQQELKPRRLYFLVQLPKVELDGRTPRRAQSGVISVSARERLESLMLSRRSVSDLTLVKSAGSCSSSSPGEAPATVQLKMKLPKAVVAKIMEESKDGKEAADKIMAFCAASNGKGPSSAMSAAHGGVLPAVPEDDNLDRSCNHRKVCGSQLLSCSHYISRLTVI